MKGWTKKSEKRVKYESIWLKMQIFTIRRKMKVMEVNKKWILMKET